MASRDIARGTVIFIITFFFFVTGIMKMGVRKILTGGKGDRNLTYHLSLAKFQPASW